MQLASLEVALGPWFCDDRPQDVLLDIRAYDPEAARSITVDDVRAYLAKKPPAFQEAQ